MKTLSLVLLLSSLAWCCPSGSSPYRDGVCTADIQPEAAPADTVKPSTEKPPRNPQPEWATGKVVDNPDHIKSQDTINDEIKAARAEVERTSQKGKTP